MSASRIALRGFALDAHGDVLHCHYCDVAVPESRLEMDHFPIPERCGGTEMVPACTVCHDLKDRIPLEQMPVEVLEAVLRDVTQTQSLVWSEASRYTRIVLAKMMAVLSDARRTLDAPQSPRQAKRALATAKRQAFKALAPLGEAVREHALLSSILQNS